MGNCPATRQITPRAATRAGRPVPEAPPEPDEFDAWGTAARLGLLAVVAFLPVIACGWTNWDDEVNFTKNPDLTGLSWDRFAWAWRSKLFGLYEPLGRIMVQAEYSAFGFDPRGYHVVSLALHAANTAALFALALVLLRRALPDLAATHPSALGRSAALAVALWAVHPLRAESVAWLSCQTYLPCVLLFQLALLAYLHAHRPGVTDRGSFVWSAVALGLFAPALLFKAVAVPLPAVLLILDAYPLGRTGPGRLWTRESRRAYLEKIPYVMISLVYARILLGGRHMFDASWSSKLATAAYGVWFYPAKTLAPVGLSAVYPPCEGLALTQSYDLARFAAVVVVTCGLLLSWRRRPGLAAAWACYLVILAPSSGVVRTILAVAADRYSYASTAALFILAAGVLARASTRVGFIPRAWVRGAAGALVLVLCGVSWVQAATWRSSLALWTQSVAHGGGGSALAQFNLAQSLSGAGRFDEAMPHYQRALTLRPDAPTHNFYYGLALVNDGRIGQAVPFFREALRIEPAYAPARKFLGLARLKVQGDLPGAEAELRAALATDPGDAETHYFLGLVLLNRGRHDEAAAQFAEALRLQPSYPDAEKNLKALRPPDAR